MSNNLFEPRRLTLLESRIGLNVCLRLTKFLFIFIAIVNLCFFCEIQLNVAFCDSRSV